MCDVIRRSDRSRLFAVAAKRRVERAVGIVTCRGKVGVAAIVATTDDNDLAVSLNIQIKRCISRRAERRRELPVAVERCVERSVSLVPNQRKVVITAVGSATSDDDLT